MKMSIFAIALCGLAGGAVAQVDGTIVYTDEVTDAVYQLDGVNTSTQLISFAPDNEFRLGGLLNVGGTFYVSNGPSVTSTTPSAEIRRLDNLFGGGATSTVLSSGAPLFNPIGLAWDATNGQILAANNPTAMPIPTGYVRGITGLNLTTLASDVIAEAVNPIQNGEFSRPIRLAKEANRDSFVIADGEGSLFNGPNTQGSVLWRMSDVTSNSANIDVLVDLGDTSVTGLGVVLEEIRGVTSVGNSLFITEAVSTDAIYRVDLDVNGDFQSITQIASGFQAAQEIVHNRYTDKLVFSDALAQRVYQMDLDGSNLEVLMEGVNARGIAIVPTPASAALLGLGGLVATRRRR